MAQSLTTTETRSSLAPTLKSAPRWRSRLAFLLGLVLAPVALCLWGLATWVGASVSGWGYVAGLLLLSAGLLSRARRWLSWGGFALLLLVVSSRLVFARGTRLETLHLPEEGHRWVNRLVDERDGTLLAAHALLLTGRLPRSDTRGFVPALEAAFERMGTAEGMVATPAIATWLGLQSAESFDALVVPPEGRDRPDSAVVFLHGFAGNFAVYCWEMAQAVRSISALTVCPSVGPSGSWWEPQGERTLKATYAWLAAKGIRRVYLGGLSNGGVGASRLVHRGVPPGLELRGLILVSGAETGAPPPGVPTLVVQGRTDTMMPTSSMRAFAHRLGGKGTYVELDSGHFAFLDRHEDCRRAISTWLRQREGEVH
ncbi:alpha/beta fold hydrolase [Corallococcus sp. CA053C]|uniref:alpha/beta fold hydrolase n=1 Tax=Corallococcus sp. CA053C TaxID=2316732 RepID=UPI001F3E80F8|nr:alpha/beta hydrolase [Corallococcus sp. CA053C]